MPGMRASSSSGLVALSGWGSEEHRQRACDAWLDQHLVKPIGVAEIRALLSD